MDAEEVTVEEFMENGLIVPGGSVDTIKYRPSQKSSKNIHIF